jgi:hypothetical protein
MKIPQQFTLGGIDWKVTQETVIPSALGATSQQLAHVALLKELQKDVKEQTYAHELVHAILYSMGKMEHDEEFVDGFATFLHQYFTQYHK